MDTNHQHLFIIGPVENANSSTFWNSAHGAPQVIMIQFFGRRSLERVDLTALRVHARHDVLDDAVLASCIHRLQNQQESPPVLCIKFALQLAQLRDTLLQGGSGLLSGTQFPGVCEVKISQPKLLPILDPISCTKFSEVFHGWHLRHQAKRTCMEEKK